TQIGHHGVAQALAIELPRTQGLVGAGVEDHHVDGPQCSLYLGAGARMVGTERDIHRHHLGPAAARRDRLESFAIARRKRQSPAAHRQHLHPRRTDDAGGADATHITPLPVADSTVQRHHWCHVWKDRVTSPSRMPNFLISDRLSITLSSIRNIQSSKSTLYTLP